MRLPLSLTTPVGALSAKAGFRTNRRLLRRGGAIPESLGVYVEHNQEREVYFMLSIGHGLDIRGGSAGWTLEFNDISLILLLKSEDGFDLNEFGDLDSLEVVKYVTS